MAYQPGDYPLPAFAAYIWLDASAGALRIGLPPTDGGTRGHSVAIPLSRLEPGLTPSGSVAASSIGIVQLVSLLRARAQSDASKRELVGTRSGITQDQLDRAMGAAKAYGQGFTPAGLPKQVEPDELGELFGSAEGQ